jgi:hypothetical protein
LEQAEAISKTFVDEVAALAQKLDGDGEKLIEALRNGEVARFRSSKADDLEAYLVREGYIDRAETLSPEEMWQRVVAKTADVLEEGVVDADDIQRIMDRFV